MLYPDIPGSYTWNLTGDRCWKQRQRGANAVIGRVATVTPKNVELYHLRLLLLNVPGATSYESIRTVNGEVRGSFREAALALGLAIDDTEWDTCMAAAVLEKLPRQLCTLFGIVLINCNIMNSRR